MINHFSSENINTHIACNDKLKRSRPIKFNKQIVGW
jgi:hypothetical protein